MPPNYEVCNKRFADFDLLGKTFVVTGGARGLGLSLAEALVEAGGKVYCLDRAEEPDKEWEDARRRVVPNGVAAWSIASKTSLNGAIVAAGVLQITPAMEYATEDAAAMLATNFAGAFETASAVARMMFKYKCGGSICFIASMSGLVANKGMVSAVYNSSKVALIQLTRSLAMEWGSARTDGSPGIRVNAISPGHIITPMVKKTFVEKPELKELWTNENMMKRLAQPEFKGAALFLLSKASSFMTGSNMIIDGGCMAHPNQSWTAQVSQDQPATV
ncbi:hypothetical protein HIM_09104 [Hirsutella minnesotensis 3608]|uniref:D-arabinitol 2-dehydrogenase n=1 Tax=Hirsutella minnesotensis 3608 TaxID=1043627 RepID=A0A0F7ZGU8_9HYPO|nr:hypothetical protein HIM_09104 [Hirsutella minnesotensis 3608]